MITNKSNQELSINLNQVSNQLELTNEQIYLSLINNFPNGAIILFDHNLRYVLARGFGLEEVGLSQELLEGKTINEVFDEEICARIIPSYLVTLRGEKQEAEINYQGQIYQHITLPIFNQQGEVIFGAVITQNITQQKQEIELLEVHNLDLANQIESRTEELKKANQELALNLQISNLQLDINFAFLNEHNLPEILQQCVETINENLSTCLARIWLYNDQEKYLKLQASAGLYTHIDGEHKKINLGQYKIGKIAQSCQSMIVNCCLTDPDIVNKQWVKEQNIVGFMGYPMLVEDELIGVIGIFSHHTIPAFISHSMEAVSNWIGLKIKQELQKVIIKNQTEALIISEARYKEIADNIPGVIYQLKKHRDGKLEFLYFSDKVVDIWGYPNHDPFYSDINQIMDSVAPEDRQSIQENINYSEQNMTVYSWIGRIFNPHRGMLWIEAKSNPKRQTDGSIIWDGILFDITEKKKVELFLDYKKRLANAISIISQTLATDNNIRFDQILGILGEVIGASRLPIHQINYENNTIKLIAMWHQPDLQINPTEWEYDLNNYPWWIEELSNNRHIFIESVDDFPDSAQAEKDFFRFLNTRQLVCTPIFNTQKQLWGFISFDFNPHYFDLAQRSQKTWLIEEEIQTLKVLGEMISVYCDRQEALFNRQQEIEFRKLIFDESTDAIFLSRYISETNYRIIDCNQKAIDLFEAKNKEQFLNIQGHTLQRYPLTESQKLEVATEIGTKGVWIRELEYRTLTNKFFWGGIAVKHICLDGQKLVLARITDITQKKKTELELFQSEQRFRRLVENANDIVYSLNLEGFFTYVSPNWTTILGHPLSEVLNHPFAPFVHPDDVDKCWQGVTSLLNTNEPQKNIEYRVKHKDGTWRWHFSNISCIYNELNSTNPISIVGIARDITERKEDEERLKTTAERLELANQDLAQATRLKDEFLANMSHELRTPLNAILGNTEILQDEIYGKINQSQRQCLNFIYRSGEHLLKLINDILDLSKIESGKINLNVSPVDIENLCESSLIFVKEMALKKKIQLNCEFNLEGKQFIKVDETRMKQVLINLLANAVKFTPERGKVRLVVSNNLQLQQIDFHVWDTGIGIAVENYHKIFQSFMQVESSLSRQYEGTGLGLALVKKIVELHGGKVTVDSELGKGSCFTVSLNYEQINMQSHSDLEDNSTDTENNQEENQEENVNNNLTQSPLILIVEDNEDNLEMISSYLEIFNYRLCIARDGLEAIEIAQECEPNLILMDIQMPNLDGLEATRIIKSQSNLHSIPIIALTALAMQGDREKCLQAGCDDYLTKPIKLKKLIEIINQHLNFE